MRDQFCCGRLPCQTYVLFCKQLQTSRLNMPRQFVWVVVICESYKCYLAIVGRGFLQVTMQRKKRIQSFYETAVDGGDRWGGADKNGTQTKTTLGFPFQLDLLARPNETKRNCSSFVRANEKANLNQYQSNRVVTFVSHLKTPLSSSDQKKLLSLPSSNKCRLWKGAES